MSTHPRLGGSHLIIFKIKQFYPVTKMRLKIAFDYSFNYFLKINTVNIEWFLHPCENYLFISQHQMHELIISLIPCLLFAHSKLIV